MKYKLKAADTNPAGLKRLFSKVEKIVEKKKGTLQISEVVAALRFSQDALRRIKTARGAVTITCVTGSYRAANKGKRVEEDIPGFGGALGIIIHESYNCHFRYDKAKKTIVIDHIKGLDADVPGPFNPDVNKMTFKLPNFVELEV